MVSVKTGSKELKFKVQGKLVDSETAVSVVLDHNVQVKLDEGSLVLAKKTAPKKNIELNKETDDK